MGPQVHNRTMRISFHSGPKAIGLSFKVPVSERIV